MSKEAKSADITENSMSKRKKEDIHIKDEETDNKRRDSFTSPRKAFEPNFLISAKKVRGFWSIVSLIALRFLSVTLTIN